MKRLAIVLCVAWGVALCCCSDDDPILDPESAQQVLQDCTHVGVFSMLRMVEAVDEIIEVISLGFGDESITATESEDPGDPDFTWNVRYDLSSTGSSNPDTRIAGKMTFSADPTDLDGIQDGDVIDLILTISTLGGPYTGSISAAVTVVDEDTSRVSGLFQLNDNAEGCNLEFDIPEVPGLAISDGTPVETRGWFRPVTDTGADFLAQSLENRSRAPSLLVVRDRREVERHV